MLESVILLLGSLAASGASDVDGLWRYETIASAGGEAVAINGLFFLKDGRCVQQSLHAGEPFERQFAMAHAGTYEVTNGHLELLAEVGIVVNPEADPVVENRNDTRHEISVDRSGDQLSFTFGTGTVQKFERVTSDGGQLFVLDRGAFALAGEHFVLVYDGDRGTMAGSGTFERQGEEVLLRAERWFSLEGGKPGYRRDHEVRAALGESSLEFEDGPRLDFVR